MIVVFTTMLGNDNENICGICVLTHEFNIGDPRPVWFLWLVSNLHFSLLYIDFFSTILNKKKKKYKLGTFFRSLLKCVLARWRFTRRFSRGREKEKFSIPRWERKTSVSSHNNYTIKWYLPSTRRDKYRAYAIPLSRFPQGLKMNHCPRGL